MSVSMVADVGVHSHAVTLRPYDINLAEWNYRQALAGLRDCRSKYPMVSIFALLRNSPDKDGFCHRRRQHLTARPRSQRTPQGSHPMTSSHESASF